MRRHFVFGAALLVGGALLQPAQATTYYYRGGDYSLIYDNTSPNGSYTTGMYVSGSFTLPNPLGPNLNFSTISPTLYSFSDGRSTIDQMNGFAPSFTISTDSSGNIKAFDTEIFVQTFATTGDFVRDIGIYLGQTDFGEIFLCLGAAGGSCVSGNGGDDNGQSFTAGIWSTSPIAAVPLPPTITLFASGLGGLGLIALRRRRKKTA